jgi:hypothetical protein
MLYQGLVDSNAMFAAAIAFVKHIRPVVDRCDRQWDMVGTSEPSVYDTARELLSAQAARQWVRRGSLRASNARAGMLCASTPLARIWICSARRRPLPDTKPELACRRSCRQRARIDRCRGHAEGMQILGIDATTAEDGAAGLTFLRSLTARRLPAVRLVTSDAHAGLLASISATLPDASCSGVAPITPPTRWR